MGKTIAVTGVNGYAASTLLPLLEADTDIEKIIGIDVRPWRGGFSKVEFSREDIRSPEISEILNQADIVCHLAVAGEAMYDRQASDDINICTQGNFGIKKEPRTALEFFDLIGRGERI